MNRPTIFLSSTIYDFQDLRSALKDYLELRGCTVFASDYTDFEKPLDLHSYHACLQTIERCNIFVLFIGSRVGGFVDEAARVSITRAEYERAYALAKEGRLRILAFVRRDVWTHRESVKELSKHLARLNGKERDQTLLQAPTKFMTDAGSIIEFIDLVSRNKETVAASKGMGAFPINNWVHQFSTFAEIRSAIDPLIFAGFEVPQAAGRAALYNRLTALLQVLIFKNEGPPFMPIAAACDIVRRVGLKTEQVMTGVTLDRSLWDQIAGLTAFLIPIRVDTAPFTPFLSDSLLLKYDPATGTFTETEEHRALNDLTQAIGAYTQASAKFNWADLVKGRAGSSPTVRVDGLDLVTALNLLLRWAAMASLATALAQAMNGKPFVRPAPVSFGPLVDLEAGLRGESVTLDVVRDFIERYEPAGAKSSASTAGS